MKKRILFVMARLSSGGAEKLLLNILKRLDRSKFELGLFLFENQGVYLDKIPDDVSYYYGVEKLNLDNPKGSISIKMVDYIRRNLLNQTIVLHKLYEASKNYDVIIPYLEGVPTYMAAKAIRKNNIKGAGWIHTNLDSYFPLRHKLVSKYYYNFFERVYVVSDECKEIALKQFPALKSKIKTIYNPIDIDDIVKKSNEKVEQLVSDNYKKIISVGRLVKIKNYDLLINAQKRLIEDGINTTLYILGEGPEKQNLEELIKKLNLEDKVRLIGYVDNPYKWIKNCDLFVLSSKFEGLPSVIIEALALNKNIVSTNCSGVKEILENGKYGEIVKVDDIDSLVNGIKKKLNDIPKEVCKRAYDFDIDKIMKQINTELYYI